MIASVSTKTVQENIAARSLTETAYRSIKNDLLVGVCLPGSRLRIDTLRKRLGIGASPIREALSRLVAEGLVTSEEQKGFRAASMSPEEFREITELRITLETMALRQSIQSGGEEWEANIVACHHRLAKAEERLRKTGTADDFESKNRDFHDALVSACDSGWLMRMREILNMHSQRYRFRSLVAVGKRRDTFKEHRLMRDATLARETDKAVRLMEQHFRTTLSIFLEEWEQTARSKARSA
jgi:GntR family carbon starvation induced transcriptional regulator